MSPLLIRSSLRFIIGRPVQLGLSVLGVAIGVALIVAIDLCNESAMKSLELSTEAVMGRTTHSIIGGSQKLPEELYRLLLVDNGIRPSSPVVGTHVKASDFPQYLFYLLGIDPFTDGSFRSYLQNSKGGVDWDFSLLMRRPNTVVMSRETAREMGLTLGDNLTLNINGVNKKVEIVGLLKPEAARSKRSLSRMLIADIATAQELLEMEGRLSRIDLIFDAKEKLHRWEEKITTLLPPEAELIRTALQEQNTEKLTQSFRFNLTVLSRFALFVSMFLIYNTITFTVIQRRTLIGRLRCLGVMQREILALILGEALLLACLGTVIGIVFGVIMGQGLIGLVARTMSELYASEVVASLDIDLLSLFKSAVVGIGATLCAALFPAWEALTTSPRLVLNRSVIESKTAAIKILAVVLGIVCIGSGSLALIFAGNNLLVNYVSVVCILLGLALLTPLVTFFLVKMLTRFMRVFAGITGRLAVSQINASLSRTGVAIAALMIAISTTVGMGVMIDSFRQTVIQWLDTRFTADIYVKLPGRLYKRDAPTINSDVIQKITSYHGIESVSQGFGFIVESQDGSTQVFVIDSHPSIKNNYRFKHGDSESIWPQFMSSDMVLVSEAYGYHNQLTAGSRLEIKTDRGIQKFPIAGVFYSYGSDMGVVLMNKRTYERYWSKRGASTLGLFTQPGSDIGALVDSMKQHVMDIQEIEIVATKTLREEAVEIFDQTFAITTVMRLFALVIAFIGILSALMALQLEKERDIGVLRATGFTPVQVWTMVMTQTGVMGLIAGLLSVPAGIIVSHLVLLVLNSRSFGWTVEMNASPDIFIQAIILSIAASLIAGIYPAYKMSKSSPALALRQE